MPFPSKGCQTCKLRRIKCDETHPICLKCIKSKRICKRISFGQDLAVVHIENQYASGQNKRPRGPRSTIAASQVRHPQPIVPSTAFDLNSIAIAYYVRYHLHSPSEIPEILKSLLQCILPRWKHDAQFQILELAVSSKALATFSRTQKYPPAAIEASSKYRQLLCTAYETIARIDQDNIDACLLAIFFMSRYEGVVYHSSRYLSQFPFLSTLQSFAHHDGAFAVLKLWRYRFSDVQPASDVVKLTRRGLIRSALLRTFEIPHWMFEGSLFGENGLDLEFDRIIVQIANIRHRLSNLVNDQQDRPVPTGKTALMIEDLCKETQEADETLQKWAAGFPILWPITQHTISSTSLGLPKTYLYSPKVYSYSKPAFGGVWANYYATRILVLSTWVTILELRQLGAHKVAQECHENIELTANDLASSLPFCLQRFTNTKDHELSLSMDFFKLDSSTEIEPYLAILMIWPLTLGSSLKHVEDKHQSWFKSVLAQLGRIIGERMFEYANTKQWPRL